MEIERPQLGWTWTDVALAPILFPYWMFQNMIGLFLRAGVFMFGEYNSPTNRRIIEWIKRCDDATKEPFTPARLEKSFTLLQNLGGIRSKTPMVTGDRLDTMLIRYADVKQEIEKHGGVWEMQSDGREVIYSPSPTKEWETFFTETLAKMGWSAIEVDGTKALWTNEHANPLDKPVCIFHCQSSAGSIAMHRNYIGRILGAHADYLSFDYPGVYKSTGVPSQEAYCAAGQTVLEKALRENSQGYGYTPDQIAVMGLCMGGVVASHLKATIPGIRYAIFDRTPGQMESVVKGQTCLAPLGQNALYSRNPKLTKYHNGFWAANQLRTIREEPSGSAIVIRVDNDTVCHQETYKDLLNGITHAFERVHPLIIKNPNPKGQGHSLNSLTHGDTWGRIIDHIHAG